MVNEGKITKFAKFGHFIWQENAFLEFFNHALAYLSTKGPLIITGYVLIGEEDEI